MKKVNQNERVFSKKTEKFGGICHADGDDGSINAADICNFRITRDGSLVKRYGFSPIMSLPGTPRAFWSGYLGGIKCAFALIDNSVYAVDLVSGSTSFISNIGSHSGDAEFYFCQGFLYLVDGDELYRYGNEGFTAYFGYIPLYGKSWDGCFGCEVNEHINYLSDKIRIHYKNLTSDNSLYIGVRCSEILSVLVNGVESKENFVFSEDNRSIKRTVGVFGPNTEIFLLVRLDVAEYEAKRREICSVTRAKVYGGKDDSRALLFGGEDKSVVFVSSTVDYDSLLKSQAYDQGSSYEYFPLSGKIPVSGGRYPITAMCNHYDRLLIFTEAETYMADFTQQGADAQILPINSDVGCSSNDGAILCGNTPYSVSKSGIYIWTSDSDKRSNCNAICISNDICDMMSEDFFTRAICCYSRKHNEAYFADPLSDEQEVFVYSCTRRCWYRFDGIPVDRFFIHEGEVAMLYGSYIFAFSENDCVDTACDGKTQSYIEAIYESNPCDFGYSDRIKRIKSLVLCADSENGEIEFFIEGDRKNERKICFYEAEDGDFTDFDKSRSVRLDIGRFVKARFTLVSRGAEGCKIAGVGFALVP